MLALNDTHAPELRSWVPGAAPGSDFPIQNLPYGRYWSQRHHAPRIGVAIGDAIVDLHEAAAAGALAGPGADAVRGTASDDLRGLMASPRADLQALRSGLSAALAEGAARRAAMQRALLPRAGCQLLLPTAPPNYTDFFASIHHASNAGQIRRPSNPLLPNFHHLPVAYHGRPSTVRASGEDVRRPRGQVLREGAALPTLEASQWLDFECEVALWIGAPNELGEPIGLDDADAHLFGLGLLNDWSARDIQMWETQPLGPFLSKNFLTTVSPWVVSADALIPFRVPAVARAQSTPPVLPYLCSERNQRCGGIDLRLAVELETADMRRQGQAPVTLAAPRFKDHYWTPAQMIAHHTVNGCELLTGDLLGTGTVSGPSADELGCLLEMNRCGQQALRLPNGETRMWLQDGDRITLRGRCEREGFVSIGFGEATGLVVANKALA